MAESLGEALLYLRTDDRGLDAGLSNARGKSEGLGRSFDDTSGKAANLGKAMDAAGGSATRLAERQAVVTKSSGAQRAGMQQLSMQLNDMATMYSLGARPMQIFASQIGQVTQAVQLASGGSSRFAAIMGSPWTMAITTAAIVLVPLIGKLFDTEDATDKAGKASETWADKLDATKHSAQEVIAALRDYNREQERSRELTLAAAEAAARAAEKKLREALATRQQLAAELEARQASASANAGQGTGGAAGAYASGQLDVTRAKIAENEAAIADLSQQARDATANVAEELAKIDTDPTERTRLGFAKLRQEARETITDVDKLRARLGELNRQEKAALDAASAAKRSDRAASSASGAASVGDMVALIKELFPGAQVTSTTGGKHTKGSDHYAGRAIDFVPGGGMGQYSTADVQRILEEAGVTIRRNASGTQQLFGPGRSASKPGDHDDHFHVAWSGGASPEEAQRRAERAAAAKAREEEKEARRVERYNRDLAGLQDAAADLQAKLTDTAEERYQLERQALDVTLAEQKRRIQANADYTDAEKAKLLAQLEIKASLERELLDRRRREELARQALEIAQAMNASEGELLQKRLQLATTRDERRAIDQQLLDMAYDDRRTALEARIKDPNGDRTDQWKAFLELSKLDENKALDQQRLDRDYESPIERYRRELVGYGDNLNDELEKVAVGALDSIADRLANIAFGAKDAMDAIKGIFKQIGVEIMRLAIQQGVIRPILSLLGMGASSGGSGGGSGIASALAGFAGFFADGGLIPTGSFGIVGEAGPEPIFATAGGVGVLPNSSLRAMGTGRTQGEAPPPYFDLRGAVMTEDLLRQMNVISQQHIETYDRGVGERVRDNMARYP